MTPPAPLKILCLGWKAIFNKNLFQFITHSVKPFCQNVFCKCRTEMVPFLIYDWEKGRTSPLRSTPICASDMIKRLQTLQHWPYTFSIPSGHPHTLAKLQNSFFPLPHQRAAGDLGADSSDCSSAAVKDQGWSAPPPHLFCFWEPLESETPSLEMLDL